MRYWSVAIARKSESAAAPKIGGVEPTPATSILSAPAASTSGGPKANVENEISYGRSFSWPDLSRIARMPSFWTPTRSFTPSGEFAGLATARSASFSSPQPATARARRTVAVAMRFTWVLSAVVVDAEPLEQLAPA